MIKTVFGIFRIKREERWLAVFAFIWMVALNVLTITKYYDKFTQIMDTYHRHFVNNFHISGFDPLTYVAVSNWDTTYNVYRHPLLAFFMYPAYLINQGLMAVTGLNCVQFVIAVILVFCAFYAFIFLYRILREVLGLDIFDAAILTIMCFSFAYVMLSVMVPDHFIISMYMLILTLYICGKMRQRRQTLSIWQTIVFFLVTAGTSLNNGIKVFMAAFFTNGKCRSHPLRHYLEGSTHGVQTLRMAERDGTQGGKEAERQRAQGCYGATISRHSTGERHHRRHCPHEGCCQEESSSKIPTRSQKGME